MIKKLLIIGILFFLPIGIFSCFSIFSKKEGKIPVAFTSKYKPVIKFVIQGKEHTFLVDSGGCEEITLLPSKLSELDKTDLKRTVTTYDFKGNKYCSPIYLVSNVNGFERKITQENYNFGYNVILVGKDNAFDKDYTGRINWKFFQCDFVFFDFPKSTIWTVNSVKKINKNLRLDHWIKVPFSIKNDAINIQVETDFGIHQLIPDTGATYGCITKPLIDHQKIKILSNGLEYFETSKFLIGDFNFGKKQLLALELDETDGLIGNDFFLEHAILFDFKNQYAYFQKPSGIIGTNWKRIRFYIIQYLVKTFIFK